MFCVQVKRGWSFSQKNAQIKTTPYLGPRFQIWTRALIPNVMTDLKITSKNSTKSYQMYNNLYQIHKRRIMQVKLKFINE